MGTGPRAAARQAAALLTVAGLLALLGISSDRPAADKLTLVAGCDFAVAALALAVPWHRARPNAPAVLGVPAFAVLGLSTWSFGGVASGTGPFLVLLYAWAALHFSRWVLLAYAAPATVAYVFPLVLTDQPPLVLSSGVVLMPVAITVGLLIEAQARHLRDDRERLERIEQWRSAMISTLAHDVRTPLTTMQMALGELKSQASGPAERMLDSTIRQAARITRLADGLLDLQRIDSSGQLKLDRQFYPARALVLDALSFLRLTDVTVDVRDDLTIDVDKQRFEQILINLVSNAERYGEPPIVVCLSETGGAARLEVRDHGPGIPAQLRSTLFTQFAVGGPDGVGLGLWIVRHLAEAHGGRATAEARDPGVAMVVTFPAAGLT